MGDKAVCAECARRQPSWDRARSVMRYDRHSRRLALMLKHGDHTHLAGALGRWMHRAGGEVLAEAELLIPVPLHWTRLFTRRYNQAVLLAQAIRAAGGPPVAADWLVRRRTPSQGVLGPAARARNVRGAFALRRGRSVKGKRVVLVDDVMTTGATAEECAACCAGRALRMSASWCWRGRCARAVKVFDQRVTRRFAGPPVSRHMWRGGLRMRTTMAEVDIYTTMWCPYCARANSLLEKKGVAFHEISLDEEPNRRGEMVQRAHGGRTVPQIFIDGEHIGGCDDMMALERAGKLDPKLGLA